MSTWQQLVKGEQIYLITAYFRPLQESFPQCSIFHYVPIGMIHLCAVYSHPRLPSKLSIKHQLWNTDINTIVAIDIGTYGYAISECQCLKQGNWLLESPLFQNDVISPPRIISGFDELDKELCAILINALTKETIEIGDQAVNLYQRKCDTGDYHQIMYFQYPYKSIYKIIEVDDPYTFQIYSMDDRHSLPLAIVITKLYQAIMKEALDRINQLHVLSGTSKETFDDIFWVLPVPVLWFYSVQTIEFIQYCLRGAGVKQFHLCGDTIAASYYVQNVKSARLEIKRNRIILDCGANSVNALSVTMDNKRIYDIHSSESLLCGAMDIGKQFGLLLEDVLPSEIINKVQEEQHGEWINQLIQFEEKLKSLPFDMTEIDYWNVPFCYRIKSYLRKEKRRRRNSTYIDIVNKVRSYSVNDECDEVLNLVEICMQITRKGWEYLHKDVLNKIVAFCANVSGDCEEILLVGNFAKSDWLKEKLKSELPNKSFLCIAECHLAVVNGALYWAAAQIKRDLHDVIGTTT